MKRIVFHVTKRREGDWQARAEGSIQAYLLSPTKKAVIENIRDFARQQGYAQIIIHGEDGKIQTEWTYGKDLHPPIG